MTTMDRMTRPWRFSFFRGDRGWGQLRLLSALLAAGLFALLTAAVEWQLHSDWARQLAERLAAGGPYAPAELLPIAGGVLRHMIAPLLGMAFAVVAAAFYIQDIYEFRSFDNALRYLFASLFGLDYPSLTIEHGQPKLDEDEHNTLWRIGGPGYVNVKLGNAVLLERGYGATRVLGPGRHFLRRFETIREVRDLREQYRRDEVKAVTKDGIDVVVRDVEATFRLATGDQPRSERQPYPFTPEALHASVYNRAVGKDGKAPEWGEAVMNLIKGRIRNWVSGQRLDRLTAPVDQDPRAAIRADFDSEAARQQLAGLGAELIWVNIGHLDTPKKVDEQRLETWRSFWEAEDKVTRAQGESLRVAYRELGRAEGQADMLVAIARALEGVDPARDLDQQVAELMLLRVGGVLEAMAAQPWLSEGEPGADGQALKAPPPEG